MRAESVPPRIRRTAGGGGGSCEQEMTARPLTRRTLLLGGGGALAAGLLDGRKGLGVAPGARAGAPGPGDENTRARL